MIKATYAVKARELQISRVAEHRSPHQICSVFDVDIKRESFHTITAQKDGVFVGVFRFDEVGYGIPAVNKKEK